MKVDRTLLDESEKAAKAALNSIHTMQGGMLLHAEAVMALHLLRIANGKMQHLEQQLAGQPEPRVGA